MRATWPLVAAVLLFSAVSWALPTPPPDAGLTPAPAVVGDTHVEPYWGSSVGTPSAGGKAHVTDNAGAPAPPPAIAPAEIQQTTAAITAAYKAGGLLGAVLVGLPLLFGLARRAGAWDRCPKRLRPWIVATVGSAVAASGVHACLVGLQPSWIATAAAVLALLAGPASVGLHQLVVRSAAGVPSPERAALEARVVELEGQAPPV